VPSPPTATSHIGSVASETTTVIVPGSRLRATAQPGFQVPLLVCRTNRPQYLVVFSAIDAFRGVLEDQPQVCSSGTDRAAARGDGRPPCRVGHRGLEPHSVERRLTNGEPSRPADGRGYAPVGPRRVVSPADAVGLPPDVQGPLVAENLGLVYDVAGRLGRTSRQGLERGDLVSAGIGGLIQAARAFDPNRGLSFSTLAVTRIRGAMLDEMRRWDHTPRSVRKKERRIKATEAELQIRLRRQPSIKEIADELDVTPEVLHAWYLDLARHLGESFDDSPLARLYKSQETALDHRACERSDVTERLVREESIATLKECIRTLPQRQARVIGLYYFEELRLREIAQLLGVTESRISQIRHAALRTLRSLLVQAGVEP
jgi:RNA polymerase sigma factor for flagellar operon FliA